MMPIEELHLDYRNVEDFLTGFLCTEVGNAGFRSVVVGLSGGVDSAVVCELAARAFGAGQVLALMMPYRTSSPESLEHAELMVSRLGIRSERIDITPVVDLFARSVPSEELLRKGNIMARARMVYLYDVSARERSLVLGTSNKTELLLGYGTLFGDMASAMNPVGDLYKTQLRGLARHLGIPEPILLKTPSADLWQGQSDEADLGFSYEEVDRLLYMMVEKKMDRLSILSEGVEPDFYLRVRNLVAGSRYKRMLPVIANVSGSDSTPDFRYAKEWQELL